MSRIPYIISVDDHVVEPPNLWLKWTSRRWHDSVPRVVRSPYAAAAKVNDADRRVQAVTMATDGPETDFWVYEDLAVAFSAGFAAAGLDMDEIGLAPISYSQMRPGCWQVPERLQDMTVNGVERSLCFPSFPRFCGQTFLEAKDKGLALACVLAYNDFMVEEWCGSSYGRLVPLCIIPLWDAELAAAEVRRNAARGVRAVAFSELPAYLGLPSIHDRDRHWDPFLRACDETGTVICIHIGSGSNRTTTSTDMPVGVGLALMTVNAQLSLTDWLLSDNLLRFPNIKVAYSEGQIGWMPYVIEQADRVWRKSQLVTGLSTSQVPPSARFVGRIYGCFFEDDFGLQSRAAIGIDQITFESDYPHQDSTWPHTQDYAERAMAGLSDEEIFKIIRGNAIKLFGLPAQIETATAAAIPADAAAVAYRR